MDKIFLVPNGMEHVVEPYNSRHFILLHVVMKSQSYTNFYRESVNYKILDNSAFELGESLDANTLLDYAGKMKVSEIVAPDKMFDDKVTIRRTREFVDICPTDIYNVMGVIQGNTVEEWKHCFTQLNKMKGVNVLAINKLCSRKFPTEDAHTNRWILTKYARKHMKDDKRLHWLGTVDVRDLIVYPNYVRSCDSSLVYRLANNYNFDWFKPNFDIKTKLVQLAKYFSDQYVESLNTIPNL